jgi:hypothetical protein
MKTLGQINFEAYWSAREFPQLQTWDELDSEQRAAWEAGAEASADAAGEFNQIEAT